MNDKIEERALAIANECIKTKKTVRQLAEEFDLSKSTVHLDLTERLYEIDKKRYYEVQKVLEHNKEQRAQRGGSATKNKYLLLKNSRIKKEG